MTKNVFSSYTPESWETARAYAANIGEVPPAFSSLMKSIQVEVLKGGIGAQLGDGSRSQLRRLLRSDSFRASYYYSLRITHYQELQDAGSLNLRKLSKLMSGEHLCYFLLTLFYFKRFSRQLSSNSSWADMSNMFTSRADIGMLVGRCLDNVGIGAGLFGATGQFLGALSFLKHDPEGFARYRNRCTKMNVLFDTTSELERWGCNSLQVLVYMGQNFGLKRTLLEGLVTALDSRTSLQEIPEKEFYRFRIASEWTESLLSTGEAPDMTHRGDFYPLESKMASLNADMQNLERLSGNKPWLTRTTEDLSEELTPQLYGMSQGTASSNEEIDPENLEDSLSDEDLGFEEI